MKTSILYEIGNYWVSNEGTKIDPKFHVWKNGITHATADSAYKDISLAIKRADYLHERSRLENWGPGGKAA